MHFLLVFVEAISIGMASYALGLLPLDVKSQSRLSAFTVFGNGQLVGAAGSLILSKFVIGAASTLRPQQYNISRTVVALADMGGMLFMSIANRRISTHMLNANRSPQPHRDVDAEQLSSPVLSSQQEQDGTEPGEPEKNMDVVAQLAAVPRSASTSAPPTMPVIGPHQQRIYLFTLALVIQLLIHGINEGHRATKIHLSSKLGVAASSLDHVSQYLRSLFENALMTFALSTTLRSASFPVERCRHHLIAASVAMPLGQAFSYTVITAIGISAAQFEVFPLFALRSFTDGMFIYAAFFLRDALGVSEATYGGQMWGSLLSLAGSCMSTVGPMLVLIPISALLKLMQRYS